MKENFKIDLRLFDAGNNVNTTEGYANANTGRMTPYTEIEGLSEEMQTYYSDYLIDNAEPKLIHDQFAQKVPIPKGNGKADGIRAALERYNLKAEETIAFGDGENDIPMLQICGIGVAMGNAKQLVKDSADYVTLSVREDGVSAALRHFGLI